MKKGIWGLVALGVAAAGTAAYVFAMKEKKKKIRSYGLEEDILLFDVTESDLSDYDGGGQATDDDDSVKKVVDVDNFNDLNI